MLEQVPILAETWSLSYESSPDNPELEKDRVARIFRMAPEMLPHMARAPEKTRTVRTLAAGPQDHLGQAMEEEQIILQLHIAGKPRLAGGSYVQLPSPVGRGEQLWGERDGLSYQHALLPTFSLFVPTGNLSLEVRLGGPNF